MSYFVYVDNSNVFIEGKRASAVEKGLALDIWQSHENGILDNDYRMDFGKLYRFTAGTNDHEVSRAVLFGSRPPANDSLWDVARRVGFEPIIMDRNVANREKKVDTGIVTEMMRDAYTQADKENDTFILVGGDGDFVPAVEALVRDGFKVEVFFWSHVSRELKEAASRFVELNQYLDHLAL